MSRFALSVLVIVAFGLSLLGAWLVLRNGQRLGLTDIPNARSSHAAPRPRGAGIGIVVAVLGTLAATAWLVPLSPPMLATVVGGLAVAAVGLYDDLRSVPAKYRFVVHLAATLLLIAVLPTGWSVALGGGLALGGVVGIVIATLAIVWLVNLFNFMDGIDGIAGVEAVFIAAAGAWLLASRAPDHPVVLIGLVTAAASSGFLVLNWPPARVFMGDVGSGFLGFMLGAMGLWSVVTGAMPLWTWVILSAAFGADATVTLLRRAVRREPVYAAHRKHAYQRLSRRWTSHRQVTLLVLAVNLIWLLPWAWMSCHWVDWAPLHAVIAVLPVVVGVWRVGAGLPGD